MKTLCMFFVALVGISFASDALSQTEEHTFELGEQSLYGCPNPAVSVDTVALEICSVYNPDGTRSDPSYTKQTIGSRGGGRCGYTVYKVQCREMPDADAHRQMSFTIGENDDGTYKCGADPVAAARDYCSIHRRDGRDVYPFTIVKTGVRGGEQCGYTTYQVKCRGLPVRVQ
jgi:hypothetical protein